MTDEPQEQTPEQPTTEGQQIDPQELLKEVEKWKSLSRQNEDRWKEASKERDQLKSSQMTDAEKELEAARAAGRTEALSEVGRDLATAEMQLQAARAGASLPDLQYLNMSGFVGADWRPNKDAITAFVSSLPKPTQEPRFTQNLGLGRQGSGTGGSNQLSREEYNSLSREDRAKARSEGRVQALLKGEL